MRVIISNRNKQELLDSAVAVATASQQEDQGQQESHDEKIMTRSHHLGAPGRMPSTSLSMMERIKQKGSNIAITRVEIDAKMCLVLQDLLSSRTNANPWKVIRLEDCTGESLQQFISSLSTVAVQECVITLNSYHGIRDQVPRRREGIDITTSIEVPLLGTPCLERLSLTGLELSMTSIQNIADTIDSDYATNNLKYLEIYDCWLAPWSHSTTTTTTTTNSGASNINYNAQEAQQILFRALKGNSTLKVIDFSGSSVQLFATSLGALKGHPSLTELDLSRTSSFTSTACMLAIFSVLTSENNKDSCLTKLDLSRQASSHESDETFAMSILARALTNKNNACLKQLHLSGNKLQDADFVMLGKALCQNSTLEKLVINDNCITSDGILEWLSYLLSSRTSPQKPLLHCSCKLQELWLFTNPISVTAVQALVKAMEHVEIFPNMKRLELPRMPDQHDNENPSNDIATIICELYQLQRYASFLGNLNIGGRKLLLLPNQQKQQQQLQVPLGIWPLVLGRVNQKTINDTNNNNNNSASSSDSLSNTMRLQQQIHEDKLIYGLDVLFHLLQGPALLQRQNISVI